MPWQQASTMTRARPRPAPGQTAGQDSTGGGGTSGATRHAWPRSVCRWYAPGVRGQGSPPSVESANMEQRPKSYRLQIGIRTSLVMVISAIGIFLILGEITANALEFNLALALGVGFLLGNIFRNWQIRRVRKSLHKPG